MSEQELSHKELVEVDRLEQFFYQASNSIYQNRKTLAGAGIGLLIAIVAIFSGIHVHQNQQIEKANQFYHAYKGLMSASDEEQLKKVDELKALAESHQDDIYAIHAWLIASDIYFKNKRWNEAEQAYRTVATHPLSTSTLKNKALLGLVAIYENQNQWAQAKEQALLIEDTWKEIRLKTLARIAIGEGDSSDAKKHLEALLNTPDTPYKIEAENLLLSLGSL